MYRRFVFWVLFVVGLPLWGKSDTLYVSHIADRTMLYDIAYCTTSTLNSDQDSLQLLLQQPQRWQRLTAKTPSFAQRSHWLRFFLTNDTDTTQTFYVYLTNANQRVTLFYAQHEQWHSTTSGSMIRTSAWAVPYSDTYVLFNIPARTTFTVVSRIAHEQAALPFWTDFTTPKPSWGLQLQKPEYHAERILDEYRRNMPEFQYRSWIQGALALVTLFLALLYYQYRHRIYAYYGVYVLCSFIFSLLKTRAYTPLGQALGEWPLLKTHLMESLLWWGIGAYLFFMTELLDLSKNHPNMKKWFLRLAFVLMGYGGLYLIVMLLTNDLGFQQFSFWGGRFVAFPIYIVTLFWIRRSVRSPMVPYVIWANVVLGFFGLLAWLRAGRVILEGVKLPANVDDLLTLSFAVVMEILVLSLAIAHRFRLNEKEKTESQRAYFQELQTKAANEKRIAETEMLALRSQMNPHFLFNSLNSLEYLIVANDEQKATQYLSKFSKLLRMILSHSREEAISLEEELNALSYYLEIEATRLGEDFTYRLEVASSIDTASVMIPPLLLQPFVENAIWHGLMPSDEPEKKLAIRITQKNEQLLEFEIEDNGIGLKKATEIRNRSTMRRKSHGMEITQRRIELFNRNYPNQLAIEVVDLKKNTHTGTLVKIGYNL